MSAIPIDILSIQGAQAYTFPTSAISMNTCMMPVEGLRGVPMIFDFGVSAVFSSNIATGGPAPVLSQLAATFIDATQSEFDITVYFPDTGYIIVCPARTSRLRPVFTRGQGNIAFYVLVNNPDGNGVNKKSPGTFANVIALNQFIPEFDGSQNNIIPLFQTGLNGFKPGLLATDTATGNGNISAGGGTVVSPSEAQIFITGIEIGMNPVTDDMSTKACCVQVVQQNPLGPPSAIAQGTFMASPATGLVQTPIRINDFNYISGITPGLTIETLFFESDNFTPLANVSGPWYANMTYGTSNTDIR